MDELYGRCLIKHAKRDFYIHYSSTFDQYYVGKGMIGALLFQEINAIGFICTYLDRDWGLVKLVKPLQQ